MGDSLTIVQSADDATDDAFVINEEFEKLSTDPFDDAWERIASFDIDPVAEIPMYDVVWPKFASSFNEYASSPSGLGHLLVLYDRLSERVDAEGVTEIRCRSVDPYYRSLLADFADNEDIRLVAEKGPPRRPALAGLIRTIGSLVFVLFDLILSLVLNAVVGRPDETTDVVFVPHLNRFDSFEPVLGAARYDHRVVAPVATLSWYRARRNGRWKGAAKHGAVPVARFATPVVFIRAVGTVVRLVISELLLGRFRRQLVDEVATEFGVRLDQSIAHACKHVYTVHFAAILNYLLAGAMIDTTGCETTVIGALSFRQQAFVLAAADRGIESHHVPHTVSLRKEHFPRRETDHIVASTVAAEYLTEEWYSPEDASIVPLGRPRIGKLVDERPSRSLPSEEPVRIVAATQPFDDRVRRQFVRDVLDGASDLDDATVTVKIHPNESVDFYRDVVADADIHVTVSDGSLRDHLERADLTAFINSNAGMESMALGTPAVSINRWRPRTSVRPFISKGPIPVLETGEDVSEFFDDIDGDRLRSLRREQIAYLDDHFVLSDDITTDIAAHIHPESP
jgi:hypothetical protein